MRPQPSTTNQALNTAVLKLYFLLFPILFGLDMSLFSQMHNELNPGKRANAIMLSWKSEAYSENFEPMHYATLGYERKGNFGSLILRGNLQKRFSVTGLQVETDYYPKLTAKTYGYLNYGFSRDVIFPKHRFGMELFTALPRDFEISFGGRWLRYPLERTTLVTASVAKYMGHLYLAGRPYMAIRENGQLGFSMTANVRKYTKDLGYFFANIGWGSNPEIWSGENTVGPNIELYNIRSQFMDAGYRFPVKHTNDFLQLGLGLQRRKNWPSSRTPIWAFYLGLHYTCTL